MFIVCIILCIINICFSCFLFYKICLLNDEIDSLYNNYSNLLDSTVKHILPTSSKAGSEDIISNNFHLSEERNNNNVKNLIRNL